MIEHSPDISELAKALHGTQAMVEGVRKDSMNPHFKNNYASLEAVIDTARPALQQNGIAFTQAPGSLVDGSIEVTTMLLHTSGQWMRSTVHIPLSKKDAQGAGSAITYGCRYSLMAALGLPPVDDDGQEAVKPAPVRQADQRATYSSGGASASLSIVQPAEGAADHLIELIRSSRSEDDMQRVTNAAPNVRIFEGLNDEDQERVSNAIHGHRTTFAPRRAGGSR